MAITYNNTTAGAVSYNSTDLDTVTYNGVEVFAKAPVTKTITITAAGSSANYLTIDDAKRYSKGTYTTTSNSFDIRLAKTNYSNYIKVNDGIVASAYKAVLTYTYEIPAGVTNISVQFILDSYGTQCLLYI